MRAAVGASADAYLAQVTADTRSCPQEIAGMWPIFVFSEGGNGTEAGM